MNSTCIITDSSVQFSKHTFSGRNLVFQVPFQVKVGDHFVENDPLFKVSSLPSKLDEDNRTELIAPSVQDCLDAIELHSKTYKEIIAIFMSSQLTQAYQNMEQASKIKPGKITLSVIDSQTTSVGLGALVQLAAENVVKGTKFIEIERKIRGKIPKIYSQFCISNLSYLQRSNFLSKPQSMLGEMLGILPVFAFEEGKMVSVEKVKNFRLLLENYQEFVDEFNDLDQVALVQSQPPLIHETHTLREHVNSSFPGTPFIELTINLALAALFGPAAVGIFAIEGRD
jgi:DegV family protein with EDD domain